MSVREGFLRGDCDNLSERRAHVKKSSKSRCLMSWRKAGCRTRKEPRVGAFQPLVNEVISGTYE